MPNPLIRLGRQNTGKKPQEHFAFGNTNMPDAPPEVEHYVGNNHPYRGTEIHGVGDTVDAKDVVVDYQATQEGITYLPEPDDEKPIPVRIVQVRGRQLLSPRVYRFAGLDNTMTPQRLIARNEARVRLDILTSVTGGNANVWLSPDRVDSGNFSTALRLTAGSRLEGYTWQDELWFWTDAVNPIVAEVQAIETIAVEL